LTLTQVRRVLGGELHVGAGRAQQVHRVLVPPIKRQTPGRDTQQTGVFADPLQRTHGIVGRLAQVELTHSEARSSAAESRDRDSFVWP
jgi:hypothetical protein